LLRTYLLFYIDKQFQYIYLVMTANFDHIIRDQGFVILDGALATELEARGANLNHSLWSAKLLKEDPSLIKAVHLDYLMAGANVITTASYQASFIGFEQQGYTKEEAASLIKLSVELAVDARTSFLLNSGYKKNYLPMIAASLGPYGAAMADGSEYGGYTGVSVAALAAFHGDRLALVLSTQADILAFETIPCLDEASAIKQLLQQYSSTKAWVSFSCKDGVHLNSGELFEDAVQLLTDSDEIVGIGVNCTAPQYIESLVKIAAPLTHKTILVYPNKGEIYNAVTKKWEPAAGLSQAFMEYAKTWLNAGAKAIGGCCRTGPPDIQQLNALL
jgi:homocysteine S-methyltransferase